MSINNIENNSILYKIIEKSLFTTKQIEIIYKIINHQRRNQNISSGAYYRQVRQTRDKIKRLYYSIILLNLLGIINNKQIGTLETIINKITILFDNHDKHHIKDINDVMNVIEEVIDKMILSLYI